jgi:hypothetical protein
MTFHIDEMLRLKAEVRAAAPQKDGAAAMNWLKESLRSARKQSALAHKLRSATTLARLLSEDGRREEARFWQPDRGACGRKGAIRARAGTQVDNNRSTFAR